jgi:hypothetical protein
MVSLFLGVIVTAGDNSIGTHHFQETAFECYPYALILAPSEADFDERSVGGRAVYPSEKDVSFFYLREACVRYVLRSG